MAQAPNTGLGDQVFIQTFTSTLQRYEKQLVDNVLKDHPALELFKSLAKSVTGRGLVIPLRAANLKDDAGNQATGYTDENGTHAVTVSAPIMGSATYNWANEIVTPFVVAHRDILMNSGPEQIVSLVEEYVKAAQADHSDFIVAELHKNRANWTTGSVFSLDMLIGGVDSNGHDSDSDTGVISGDGTIAVGGIDHMAAGKSYWRATRIYDNSSDIIAAMRKVTNSIYKSSRKRPTDVIAGFDVFEELESYLQNKGYYTSNTGPNDGTANTRFTTIKFGDLTVRLDPDCQEDRMYFLNRASLRFAYCAGEFMKTYPAQPIQGTLNTVVPIASTVLFGVAERRANGLLIRKAAAADEILEVGNAATLG